MKNNTIKIMVLKERGKTKIISIRAYAFLRVIVLAALSMMAYTSMSLRFGISHEKSMLQLIAGTYDRSFSVAIGILAFWAVVGFYLQSAFGDWKLDVGFWREFSKIENVVAIKLVPFNRYQTFDVTHGVAELGSANVITLCTGNDDNFLIDILSEYKTNISVEIIKKRIVAEVLVHWAVSTWTEIQLLEKIKNNQSQGNIQETLVLTNQIIDSNAAFFDVLNTFKGCIMGVHDVLCKQDLLEVSWTLDENETISPGHKKEIGRVYAGYPHLNDDYFVTKNLNGWQYP